MIRRHPLLLSLCALLLGVAASAHANSPVDATQVLAWREQARALEHGEGVPKDADAAIALYCRAAMAGDAQARYDLGWIYANGRGTERNDAFAAYFFQQAADQGDAMAQRMLSRVGAEKALPPCVQKAQAEERERLAREEAARAQQELEAQARHYETLAETAQQRQVLALLQRLAPEYGVHPGLAYAVIRAESNFNPQAVSEKNAQGLMQLIPETAARFRVRKPMDPEQNIRGGLSYLRWLLAYFEGNVPLALAGYNAGEGAVERYRGVPPYPETRGYIRRIQEVFKLQQQPFDARVTPPSSMGLASTRN